MKDFYDVAWLARNFDFDAELLSKAIRATFERRKTLLPTTTPLALTSAFADDLTKKIQWSAFLRKSGIRDADTLAETIANVRAFVETPLLAEPKKPTLGLWRAGGPWS